MEPELIADYECECGEGPLYHPLEKKVYWIDIPTGRLFWYDPETGGHEMCYQDNAAIGGFTIQADGKLLLFCAKGTIKTWKEGNVNVVVAEIPEELGSRFNDVIADPLGRVYCGTMPTGTTPGRLYRLDTDGTLTKLLDGIECSNGMGFSPDRRHMYYVDSMKHEVYRLDYNESTGALSNQKVILRNTEEEGLPDGMTVDAQGDLWIACWDGGILRHVTADGVERGRIAFPARKVSSAIFGGSGYTDLYVTTAGGNDKASEGTGAGGLFRLRPGVKGVPEFVSRIGIA